MPEIATLVAFPGGLEIVGGCREIALRLAT
jgi:hypothetical protein